MGVVWCGWYPRTSPVAPCDVPGMVKPRFLVMEVPTRASVCAAAVKDGVLVTNEAAAAVPGRWKPPRRATSQPMPMEPPLQSISSIVTSNCQRPKPPFLRL